MTIRQAMSLFTFFYYLINLYDDFFCGTKGDVLIVFPFSVCEKVTEAVKLQKVGTSAKYSK